MSQKVNVDEIEIVGHRGAKGLKPENTIASIKEALKHNVDAIEFDVSLTKDNRLILCHDDNLKRTTGEKIKVHSLNFDEIMAKKTLSGLPIPTLEEALDELKNEVAIIEAKDISSVHPLIKVIDNYPKSKIMVTSFKHGEVELLKIRRPELFVFAAEKTRPLDIIPDAVSAKANGITLHVWLLNPLTYWLAKRSNLKIMVYTVNYRFVAWFIHTLYPGVILCTNFPDRIHRHKI